MRETVSEQAKIRACELMRQLDSHCNWKPSDVDERDGAGRPIYGGVFVLASYIQQVSDAAKAALDTPGIGSVALKSLEERLSPHILSDPVDPLLIEAEVLAKQWNGEAGNFALLCLKRGIELAAPRSKEER